MCISCVHVCMHKCMCVCVLYIGSKSTFPSRSSFSSESWRPDSSLSLERCSVLLLFSSPSRADWVSCILSSRDFLSRESCSNIKCAVITILMLCVIMNRVSNRERQSSNKHLGHIYGNYSTRTLTVSVHYLQNAYVMMRSVCVPWQCCLH